MSEKAFKGIVLTIQLIGFFTLLPFSVYMASTYTMNWLYLAPVALLIFLGGFLFQKYGKRTTIKQILSLVGLSSAALITSTCILNHIVTSVEHSDDKWFFPVIFLLMALLLLSCFLVLRMNRNGKK